MKRFRKILSMTVAGLFLASSVFGATKLHKDLTGSDLHGTDFSKTISGTLPVANGGTNATSYAQSNGLLYYDGTRLVADTAALTSGRIPYATTNGRLTDSANLTYNGNTLTIRDEHGYVVSVGGEFTAQPYELAGTILGELTAAKLIFSWDSCPNAETDLSNNSNAGTYNGTMLAADRLLLGRAWTLDFDGTDDYVSVADSDTLSFTNGSADSAFSIGGWIEVTDTAAGRSILAKWDAAEKREYALTLGPDEKLVLNQYDETNNKMCGIVTKSALSAGWHFIVATQSGTGGATAMNTAIIYVDGLAVASTASNDAGYVCMQNQTTLLTIGAHKDVYGYGYFFPSDMGQVFITGEALSAAAVWKMYLKTRGYYKK
ncbi:MAG TPA: hypothetical protein PLZ78_08880 [Spirochaetota bacterium]|nr:hypothetical protein [Spirochaetota bacterium]